MTNVKKYLRGETTLDEQVGEGDSCDEDNTGRITEPQGRSVRYRRPLGYLNDYELY